MCVSAGIYCHSILYIFETIYKSCTYFYSSNISDMNNHPPPRHASMFILLFLSMAQSMFMAQNRGTLS